MIRIENVTQYYGATAALRNVSLEVQTGELLAVMGPNGSGKSTLLQVAAGVLWPLEGYVEINGLRRRSTAENELAIRQQVVYLPAEPWLPAKLPVSDFLVAVGRVYGHADKRLVAHVDKLLSVFNLTEQVDAFIPKLSTGQRKKVALCSAFITEAPVMILDEPFAGGLDPSGILALRKVLTHLAARNDVTVLMATPVPEIVEALAHRVAVIDDRTVTHIDSPQALREQCKDASTLQSALEQLLQPKTQEHVEEYLEVWQ